MTIGELARTAGVPTSTLRFYERRGLLAPASRTRARYRTYDAAAVDRVLFLRRASELGFTLRELALLLNLSRGVGLRRGDVERVGREKLGDIDARIGDLRRVRRAIERLLRAPCFDPEAPCPIVSALARTPAAAKPPRKTGRPSKR